MDFLEQKKLSDASRFATVIVKLNAKYNPSNLYLIEQHIRRVFESTGSPLSSFQYPHEYILIAEKKALEKALDQMKELADTYHDILTIGIGSDHALMHQNRSYREADIARKACIGGPTTALIIHLHLPRNSPEYRIRMHLSYCKKSAPTFLKLTSTFHR